MPLFDIIVLSAIVTVFVTFGVVLAGLSWYCRAGRKQEKASPRYPTNAGLIVDD